jgi:hypothetical protein
MISHTAWSFLHFENARWQNRRKYSVKNTKFEDVSKEVNRDETDLNSYLPN